ncbi:MAG: hypothetical protein E5W91_21345 [Mesorhizobium sp.]|uniref:hypothetical protein n=1 Tax=Mesorhizobium sp. TaxID=1871066 RepID=UPI001219B957|nr:hypothetical protein [Mesorhizobium sp.]TIS55689.1 MAG: hypothetical protein E5W91_21345 [Mesorhizobium sp.]
MFITILLPEHWHITHQPLPLLAAKTIMRSAFENIARCDVWVKSDRDDALRISVGDFDDPVPLRLPAIDRTVFLMSSNACLCAA